MQTGFIQNVTEIQTKLEIKSKPQPLHQRRNPVNAEQVECYLHLQPNIVKGEIGTDTLRHLALETMNIRYPPDKWLHILSVGCQIDGYINAGAGIYCEIFSCYMALGQHSTARDGEIEPINTALRLPNLHQNKFERAVIFSDSKAAIRSAGSTETVISTEARDCQALIGQLKAKHKLHCSRYQDTAKSQGMNMPMHWPKGATIAKTYYRNILPFY